MKVTTALLAAVSVAAVNANTHQHGHAHLHEKRSDPVVEVAGPTIVAYELDGETITKDEVLQGCQNGTLVLANGGCDNLDSVAIDEPLIEVEQQPTEPEQIQDLTEASADKKKGKGHKKPYVPAPAAPSTPIGGGEGVGEDFPDGVIPCSTFPSKYGAIALDHLGLGGWTGVQTPGKTVAAGFDDIHTALTGGECTEGGYCSYHCPAGYLKAQWPETQGCTGQSVGGLLCKGGKLRLTRGSVTKKLCQAGASQVKIKVQNKMGQNVAICKTDYPGTENMVLPYPADSNGDVTLSCPDASNYYEWQGKPTSAQYYANPAGVSTEDACQWGSAGGDRGNFAPMNFGVGYSNGAAWLSIFQNTPTQTLPQDYRVEITGSGVSGSCVYKNGQYCGDTGCDPQGCTVRGIRSRHF